jgi:hypothetical protein
MTALQTNIILIDLIDFTVSCRAKPVILKLSKSEAERILNVEIKIKIFYSVTRIQDMNKHNIS